MQFQETEFIFLYTTPKFKKFKMVQNKILGALPYQTGDVYAFIKVEPSQIGEVHKPV